MASSFMEHSIAAIRHQMKALDESLALLERQLREPVENPLVCPQCQSPEIEMIPLMGPDKQYFCKQCDWKGPLVAL